MTTTSLNRIIYLIIETISSEFSDLPDDLRINYEGYRAGLCLRLEFENFPAEFLENHEIKYPMVVGGLLPKVKTEKILVPLWWHQSFAIIFSPYIGAQIKLIIANSSWSRNSSILIKLTNTVSNLIFFTNFLIKKLQNYHPNTVITKSTLKTSFGTWPRRNQKRKAEMSQKMNNCSFDFFGFQKIVNWPKWRKMKQIVKSGIFELRAG